MLRPTKLRRFSVTTWTRFGIVLGWSPPRKFPAGGGRRNSAHVRAFPRRLHCRARHPCVFCPEFHSGVRRRQGVPARRSRRSRDQARSRDQERRRQRRQSRWRNCGATPTPRSRRTTSATASCCSARSSPRRPTTARAGCASPAPSSRSAWSSTATASRSLERAGTAAYIAYQRAKNRNEEADALVIVGRTFGDRQVWRPALDALRLSLELREIADVRALYEKMREDHGFRLLDYTVDADSASPRACFQFSEDAAGQAHRLLAVRRGRRPGQARAVRRRQAALRRGAQARRTLQRDLARRTAVDRQGDAVEVGRPHDLRARPQGDGALRRQGLRAAAHRPARHSAGQRQHQGGRHRGLPHQRPQPDRDRARPRLPAQPLSVRASSG